jgi:tetratricopeptide (TPR) repeat protein
LNPQRTAREWLAIAQAQLAGGDLAAAQGILAQALSEHPRASELLSAQAGVLQLAGRVAEAESLLRELLDADPGEAASAFTLADMLKKQGRTAAAASTLRACFAQAPNRHDADLAIRAVELLDDCDRKADAAAIAEGAIEAHPDDARLHAYAGMLQIQLGEFELARRHYLFALEHDRKAWEWHVPIGLSSTLRYVDANHPDFAMLRAGLLHDDLSELARAELHFALGKAHDDIGDYRQATHYFGDGNIIAHRLTQWTRKSWRRAVEARLATPVSMRQAEPTSGFTPVFIVGMPRSGTTLLAELLSHYPRVRNRGELPWIAKLAGLPALAGKPDRVKLEDAAATYAAQSRRDDAGDALWFIDKQPLNFRYVNLILALFPDARIIHCRRCPRDTALSLWMQCFLEDVQGYAYDFGDIALVMRDCERLMERWLGQWPDSIRTIRYEELVADTHGVVDSLARWIGFPSTQAATSAAAPASAISTASLWQARQPVNSHSVGRWKRYVDYLPELLQFSE